MCAQSGMSEACVHCHRNEEPQVAINLQEFGVPCGEHALVACHESSDSLPARRVLRM
ncbi:hypothetical protein PISMIDRAFT_673222 [Pisolithus microcarpus 441]|uniref:Unplaced genomic scaffold scaffold_7, whole genome shotgun sequence n=1 Tax=Pisolithus microcarpus 441 TaxID=765257 RepID=A0A0C9ZI98_9AGAM|nr:hypothetical protein PISMIDRAFT_673222 [Pisolithus microcarpus 441]